MLHKSSCDHQKNEAGSSNACELVGLQRTFTKLGSENVSSIVTDRNRTVTKYLREQQPNVKHRFDLWHVAKCKQQFNIDAKSSMLTLKLVLPLGYLF